MIPGTDSIDLMRAILETADAPIILLPGYGQEDVVAQAFDLGAADYVVKLYSPTELAARIKAALRRRATPEPAEPYVLGDLTINYSKCASRWAASRSPLWPWSTGCWLSFRSTLDKC